VGRAVLRRLTPEPSRELSQLAAETGNSAALRVWTAFALLMILAAVPLFSTVLPPLFDYPNHLARMHLLREGGDAFYAVRWAPLPNLAQDLIVPPLARLMPLEIASKLFLVTIFGLIAGGAIWLNRIATGDWRLWPLLAFLLLYNRIFLWGFINYLFGVGVALCGAALWLALERKRGWLRVSTSSLVALVCYFSHIAAFGFYALVILGVELSPALAELRARRRRALCRRIAVAGAQFVIPTGLFFGYWHQMAPGVISHAGFWRKADLLFSVFDNYDRAFDIACFALFIGLIGWLAWTRRLRLIPRLRWAVWVVFAAYLLLPSQMYGGSGADHRLPVCLFLLLIASSAPHFPTRRAAIVIGITAGSVLVLRLAAIEHVWRQADLVYAADLVGIDALPRGAKLAVAVAPGAIHLTSVPEVHLPALAIWRREAFVPTLFAYQGQQPVALTPAYAALAGAAAPQRLWAALVGENRGEPASLLPILERYDYVAVTGRVAVDVSTIRCLQPFFQRPSFHIFAIPHDPGCASPEG
jgi:hypothetical protein